jgi:hypothetical protein
MLFIFSVPEAFCLQKEKKKEEREREIHECGPDFLIVDGAVGL